MTGWITWLLNNIFKRDLKVGAVADRIGAGANSIFNKYTGAGLTGADIEANAFTAEQAELANERNVYNYQNRFQWQSEDMRKAGLNTALMYGGASSPSAVAGAPAASSTSPQSQGLGDLISGIMDIALLNAQIQNINADTRGKEASAIGQEITNTNLDAQMKATIQSTLAGTDSVRAETLYKNLLMQYGMPEAEVNKVLKDIQIGDSSITRNNAEAELAKVNAAYAEVKKKIDLDKLPYEVASMSASARESRARSIVDEFRGAYMQQNNTDVPSGAIASLVGLISNSFHGLEKDVAMGESGWNDLNYRTLFPFIDMLISAFGK